jgi:hypothetical protein
MTGRLAIFSVWTLVACGAAMAQVQPAPAPALVAPAPPGTATVAALPALELVRGYLAAIAALPLTHAARDGQGILTVGIDGIPYQVNAANADQFIALMQARMAAYGEAIKARGSPTLDGQYDLVAGPACKGEKLDPRIIFAGGRAPGGTPIMATTARIVQAGIETDLLVTLAQNRQVIGEIISGAAVEDVVIFSDVMGKGFSLYGTIKRDAIELRFDAEEVKDALGPDAATEADWQAFADCVFTLTKR